jgi:hypothetical protein
MKVDYDSEAHSLLFEFRPSRGREDGDYVEEMSTGECFVHVHEGRAQGIQLLHADGDISPLDEAATRFDLDAEGLRAAAQAALTAPDREILIEVGRDLTLEDEPVPTGATRPSG